MNNKKNVNAKTFYCFKTNSKDQNLIDSILYG